MENQFSNLSIKGSQSQPARLMSNVYRIRTKNDLIVDKYIMTIERVVMTERGREKFAVKANGPEPLRLLRSKVAKAALLVFSRADRYKDTVMIYDGNEGVYSNRPITEDETTQEISVDSLRLSEDFNLTDVEKRIVLVDSVKLILTLKPDGGLTQIQTKVRECDREEPSLINFYSAIMKSAAPDTKFFGLRGGRLFDVDTFQEVKIKVYNQFKNTGIVRGKGVKMGIKLIGRDVLSIALDIDSKDGTFFKAQPLINSVADNFNCSEAELRLRFRDPNFVRKVEKFIRDMVVRDEGSDRVFTAAGFKWERDENEERYIQSWLEVCTNDERKRKYGEVPVVVEERVNSEKNVIPSYYPLTALHLLRYSRVPLPKQERLKKPESLKPATRVELIDKARKDILIDGKIENLNLKGFGTEIAPSPVFPVYEILPAPTISAALNGRICPLVVDRTKHSYNSNKHQFVVPAQISHFQVIFDNNEIRDERMAKDFYDAMGKVCEVKGMRAASASYCDVGSPDELERKLESLVSKREAATKDGVVPTVIVLCIGFKDHHDYLKFVEHKYRVICQQVMKFTVERVLKGSSFATSETLHNIVKKINEKCGGTNIEVASPTQCSALFPSRTGEKSAISLIIGMDVCHGDPLTKYQERRGFLPDPSIIGLSSNALTKNPQLYTGEYIPTQSRRESVPDEVMQDHGAYLIEKFRKNQGRLPDNVILVRDGVARSQYEMALGEFASLMTGVRKAVNSDDFKPRELLIVVTKEHGMRLFDKKNNVVCNPPPGTVVDSEIVSPFLPEFLLIPQDAFHGTAKCVLATVLKDGDKELRKYPRESLDEMKYFLHTLCFLHGISDKSTGLPEPVSVGHDLAERGANVAKQIRWNHFNKFRTEYRPSVEDLKTELKTRGTQFEGVKFTA